jgi:hypothetical protein
MQIITIPGTNEALHNDIISPLLPSCPNLMLQSVLIDCCNFNFYVMFYIIKHFESIINQAALAFALNLNYFNQIGAVFDLFFQQGFFV